MFIEMLTRRQQELLANEIKSKYKMEVRPEQIIDLPLNKFECLSRLTSSNGKEFIIKGKVNHFDRFPLKLDFWSPENTVERVYFEEILNRTNIEDREIDLKCEIASHARNIKEKIFKIDPIGNLQLNEKLFASTNSTFMIRCQDIHLTLIRLN